MKKNKGLNGDIPNTVAEDALQKGLFKKKRAGVLLTKKQVDEIKDARKKLRADMRAAGIKSKKEFELSASSLGLYFDKGRKTALVGWFLRKYGGWVALGLAGILMASMLGISTITEMKGHFTINMTRDLFTEGFVLSETAEFDNPTSHLFSTPAADVPCVSIIDIPENVDDIDGEHNGNYFAYTFYIKNEGDKSAAFRWELRLNSESQSLSEAAWAMVFVDGEMTLYAKARDDGTLECLPSLDDTKRKGYSRAPLMEKAAFPSDQYEVNTVVGSVSYWRVKPYAFESDDILASGEKWDVEPGEYHKFTIVLWLEGDDPDCTNELIGGHLGYEMYMTLIEKE